MKKSANKKRNKFVFGLSLLVVLLLVSVFVIRTTKEKLDLSLFRIDEEKSVSKIFVLEGGEWVEWEEERIVGERNFEFAPIQSIPQNLIDAFVAIEDKRFYKHFGVDFYRTASAGVNYLLDLTSSFGGSTITQQLIKNVTGRDENTVRRKMQEIVWALRLERELSKEEILELYLNVINLADNCYGVGSASRRYFSKDVSELTLIECAAIAAITNNPSYYNPRLHPENNKKRRDLILSEMYEQGKITQSEFEDCYNKELVLMVDKNYNSTKIHSWYVDMVIEDVISDLVTQKNMSRPSASNMVFSGGLEIYIQIDRKLQAVMDEYYQNTANFPSGEGAQSAMMIIDSQNGDILGVVGAIGEKHGNRIQNYATDTLRSPGSTIKPLSVYAPALERGVINYASVYDDVPIKFNKRADGSVVGWPKNANGFYHGLSTMPYSMANSTNTVSLAILEDLGLSHSFYFLRDKLGMDSLIERGNDNNGASITDMDYSALALGQLNIGLTMREITAAYSIFADNGKYHTSRSYSLVKDSLGNVLLEKGTDSRQVISDGNAEIMTKLLQDVVNGGTADSLKVKNKVAIACKTGTTQDNKDRWCIGYTPSFICGVWYGYEYPREIPSAEKNHFLDAFDVVISRIYERDIYSAYKDRKFESSAHLSTVAYCKDSGLLPTEACYNDARGSRIKIGYFVKGTEPKVSCNRHILVDYDAICGGVATIFTPSEHIKRVGMIKVEREFPIQICVSDAQYVYRSMPEGILPSFDGSRAFFAPCQKKNKYFGMSNIKNPFNRLCTSHFSRSDLYFAEKLLRN